MAGDLRTVAGKTRLTAALPLRTVRAVVNDASGGVGPGAAEALEAIVASFGLEIEVAEARGADIPKAVKAAVDAAPDLLVVLAGDGTARLAAELSGPDGPVVAPLPGGTMNMLPRAIYGNRPWREALHAALSEGEVRPVSGGEVSGAAFYCAAILGAPALWADAREAVREGDIATAVAKAKRAYQRAFAGRLRYVLGERWIRKAEALTLICPLISRRLTREEALEANALDPKNVGEGVRLGLRAAFSALGDWRDDPAVETELCVTGRAWAHGHIPAILDGESYRFERAVTFSFRPDAFRVLAPPAAEPAVAGDEVLRDSVREADGDAGGDAA
jgi:diacylglycerol kinase family enzyme